MPRDVLPPLSAPPDIPGPAALAVPVSAARSHLRGPLPAHVNIAHTT